MSELNNLLQEAKDKLGEAFYLLPLEKREALENIIDRIRDLE